MATPKLPNIAKLTTPAPLAAPAPNIPPPPEPTPEQKLESLRQSATEFIITLAEPTLTDRDVGAKGVECLMALYNISTNPNAFTVGLNRLRRIWMPPGSV